MKVQEMIEFVQLHHPEIAPNIIRTLLNERRRKFAHATSLNRTYVDLTTVSGQAIYPIPSGVIDIYRVDYDESRIQRRPGEPPWMGDASSTGTIVPGP